MRKCKSLEILFATAAMCCVLTGYSYADITWYRFSKAFIAEHYSGGTPIGALRTSHSSPAKNAHKSDCGGNDGELHIGVEGNQVVWSNAAGEPISALADGNDEFGIVAEPPNVSRSLANSLQAVGRGPATFFGYFRLWNEGHDRGNSMPSNPHHVLELHPIWGIESANTDAFPTNPTVIFPMPAYSGYGAGKLRPLFHSMAADKWPRVYEDDQFVYVGMEKAENFYQLAMTVKRVKSNSAATLATVDVFSDANHSRVIYRNLAVVAAARTRIATRLKANWSNYLLGFFSVNLARATASARGHRGEDEAVYAPGTLEFFTFGVPMNPAALSSKPCLLEEEE